LERCEVRAVALKEEEVSLLKELEEARQRLRALMD